MMRLAELIDNLPIELKNGSMDAPIAAIAEDSRAASEGTLFIARTGTVTDGRKYIADAVAAGATAVLTDRSAAC